MESPTKVSTVNGTLQKATKHQDTRLETGVEGNGYGRAETIEDIISELNATAKKDAPLSEAPADVMLHGDGQQSLDPEDRRDLTSDTKASSSGNVGAGERDSTPASTLEEAKSAALSTDVSVFAEGENIVASHASEIDSEDASKVENAANGDSDQPLEGQEASECLNTLETDAEKSVNECNDKETTKAIPDVTEANDGPNEVITSEIKAPDEAVMSPRRTARQRTASLKVTESATSSPTRKRRHGSEASDESSVDAPPSKQESKQGCITSDSEADVPLAKRRCRMSSAEGGGTKATTKTNRLTSGSEGDSPLAKLKRIPKRANRLASNNEGDSTLAKRKRNPKLASKVTSESESDSPLVKRQGSAKLAKKIPEQSQTSQGDVQSVEPPSKKKSKKNLLKEFPEDKEAVKSDDDKPDLQSPEQNSTKRSKPTDSKRAQNLANKAKRKALHEEHPLSGTPVNDSACEDSEGSCGVSKPKKIKDKAGSSTADILDSTGAASATVGKKKKLVKPKELKDDNSIGLNVGDGGSGGTHADEKGNSFPEQNSFAQSAEAVSSWSPSHFKASDHHLQKSIQLSLRDWAPSARPSYLTIEVPSVNARRMWGPGFSRQRPTVVFGGCDPLNTYVNVDGVRVLLLQWQKVSNIIPTIRLTDIFQCFKHM